MYIELCESCLFNFKGMCFSSRIKPYDLVNKVCSCYINKHNNCVNLEVKDYEVDTTINEVTAEIR